MPRIKPSRVLTLTPTQSIQVQNTRIIAVQPQRKAKEEQNAGEQQESAAAVHTAAESAALPTTAPSEQDDTLLLAQPKSNRSMLNWRRRADIAQQNDSEAMESVDKLEEEQLPELPTAQPAQPAQPTAHNPSTAAPTQPTHELARRPSQSHHVRYSSLSHHDAVYVIPLTRRASLELDEPPIAHSRHPSQPIIPTLDTILDDQLYGDQVVAISNEPDLTLQHAHSMPVSRSAAMTPTSTFTDKHTHKLLATRSSGAISHLEEYSSNIPFLPPSKSPVLAVRPASCAPDVGIQVSVGHHSMQGLRDSMEDRVTLLPHPTFNQLDTELEDGIRRSFFAVFDGHAGDACADFCAQQLHRHFFIHEQLLTDPSKALSDAIVATEDEFNMICAAMSMTHSSGSTALCAYLENDRLWCANVGDSRAVICKNGKAEALTSDHKPGATTERARIERCGGRVATALNVKLTSSSSISSQSTESKAKSGKPKTVPAALSHIELTQPHQLSHSSASPQSDPIDHTMDMNQSSYTDISVSASTLSTDSSVPPTPQIVISNVPAAAPNVTPITTPPRQPAPFRRDASTVNLHVSTDGSGASSYNAPMSPSGAREVITVPSAHSGCWSCCLSFSCSHFCLELAFGNLPLRAWPGGLSVSRTIGDIGIKRMKEGVISAEPEVCSLKIEPSHRFLILACDGVWDVCTNQVAVDCVDRSLAKHKNNAQRAAKSLAQLASHNGSTDNISVIVIVFKHADTDGPTTVTAGRSSTAAASRGDKKRKEGRDKNGKRFSLSTIDDVMQPVAVTDHQTRPQLKHQSTRSTLY